MKKLAAFAFAATATAAFAAGPLETKPIENRIEANRLIPHQQEGSEGYLSTQEAAAAIGQGHVAPTVRDGVVYDPVPVTTSMSFDDRLASDVSLALANDPSLRGAYLNVDAVNGEVRVTGTIADYSQAARVRRVAENIAGPARVMTSLAPR